ncbi:MAG TPA: class I SAM-dependent methyltransferase [Bryobacterales bacterium]|nr:class I SAM-dependent methyltransferase [Bryobacterales bacterium]
MHDQRASAAYDGFARIFDLYWADLFADDVRPAFQNELLPHVPAGGRILDLCCGGGRISYWLTGCGFRVTGVDVSEEMVRLARENAPRAEFEVADVREFRRPGAFDAVISTFDSLNHLPTSADLLTVFRNVYESLAADGLFFFDMNLEEGFRASEHDGHSLVKDDHVCVVESNYDSATAEGRSDVTVFEKSGDVWKRIDLQIVEYCYPEGTILDGLAAAGFHDWKTFDGQQDLEMRNGIGRLFVLARK